MEHFLKSKKLKAILIIMALLAGILAYAVSAGGYTIPAVDILNALASPFQKASNAISGNVEYALTLYQNAENGYEENEELRKEVAELHRQLSKYEEVKQELTELKSFVGIKETYDDFVITSPCEVTGYVTNDPFYAFNIDCGKNEGISLYDPVVTEEGLVGVITKLGNNSATVTTILSPDLSVAVYCSTTKDHGVLTGSVGYAMQGMTKLQYLDKETTLRKNQKKDRVILTSGENGLFPKGYVVGYVNEVKTDDSGLTACASIKPAADVRNLHMVVVVTDFEGKGVESHENQQN